MGQPPYQWSPLNQLTSIKDPEQNTFAFTYDLRGRRLTKRFEMRGKKSRIYRYLYLGDTEIGCLNEEGSIIELKIPSDPNNPEAPAIAIEIKKDIYVPLYDILGNITCLLDHQRRKVVESYSFSAFGEEVIRNRRGSVISD